MDAIQNIYLAGGFHEFGLSNFSPSQTLEIHDYAKSRGYVLPTRFQVGYSLAERLNESALFPTLRALGISLQAYSPLSMGLLAKSPEDIEAGTAGQQWDPESAWGRQMRDRYYYPEYMEFLRRFGGLAEESGVERVGLAYRWVRYHSLLDAEMGDEMILGGTDAAQVEEALGVLEDGPLEDSIVKRLDAMWDIIKPIAKPNHVDSVKRMLGVIV